MAGGYTYYWSGCADGYHAQGVAVSVSNKLTPMIIEVTRVNERIMRRRIRHSLGYNVNILLYQEKPPQVFDLHSSIAYVPLLKYSYNLHLLLLQVLLLSLLLIQYELHGAF